MLKLIAAQQKHDPRPASYRTLYGGPTTPYGDPLRPLTEQEKTDLRIDAAANKHDDVYPCRTYEGDLLVAREMLAAADRAEMAGTAGTERAAQALYAIHESTLTRPWEHADPARQQYYRQQVGVVLEALRGKEQRR
jgi:hypothetical protein